MTETYPWYSYTTACLFAFLSKDKMIKIENTGSNMNSGIIIDFYITRRMVLHYSKHPGTVIKKEKFIYFYKRLTETVLDKII